MLRVEIGGFTGGHAEELRIEFIDPLPQKASGPHIHLPRRRIAPVEEGVDVPAVFGNFDDSVTPFHKHGPERIRTRHSTRQPASNAYYRDSFVMIFSHFPGAAPLHPASEYRVVACGKCQVLKIDDYLNIIFIFKYG
ncbi:hypothetical protein GGE65_004477 [Skermanella aerolata]